MHASLSPFLFVAELVGRDERESDDARYYEISTRQDGSVETESIGRLVYLGTIFGGGLLLPILLAALFYPNRTNEHGLTIQG